MRAAALTAALLLALIAVLHAGRVVLGIDVLVGGHAIPMFASIPAALITGGLAIWLLRERSR